MPSPACPPSASAPRRSGGAGWPQRGAASGPLALCLSHLVYHDPHGPEASHFGLLACTEDAVTALEHAFAVGDAVRAAHPEVTEVTVPGARLQPALRWVRVPAWVDAWRGADDPTPDAPKDALAGGARDGGVLLWHEDAVRLLDPGADPLLHVELRYVEPFATPARPADRDPRLHVIARDTARRQVQLGAIFPSALRLARAVNTAGRDHVAQLTALLERAPGDAAWAMGQMTPAQAAAWCPDDLVPWCEHPAVEVREAAVLAVARVGGAGGVGR